MSTLLEHWGPMSYSLSHKLLTHREKGKQAAIFATVKRVITFMTEKDIKGGRQSLRDWFA